jgi:uncharacterized protein YutE (UPF0331/DUF86 family)
VTDQDQVDVSVVRDVLDRHLPDFEAFVAAIRQQIGDSP